MKDCFSKIIVERPRYGGTNDYKYERRRMKMADRTETLRFADSDFDHTESKTTIKDWTRKGKSRPKELNEHLSPLRRWLVAQEGRPWDDVHSELRALSSGGAVQWHIWQHARDYVETNTYMKNGEVWVATSGTDFRVDVHPMYYRHGAVVYVHPETGLLCVPKHRPMRRYRQRHYPRIVIDAVTQLHYIDGIWYEIGLSNQPEEPSRSLLRQIVQTWSGQDGVFLGWYRSDDLGWFLFDWSKRTLTLEIVFGKVAYPVSKRQIGSDMLRRYGLVNGMAPKDIRVRRSLSRA